jgi:hypothetical protein
MSPPSRNAPASSIVMNPFAQATIVRAAGSACCGPTRSVTALLLLSYALTLARWCAFAGLLWAFHIAGDRVLGYGLKFASGFQDTHLGRIGQS